MICFPLLTHVFVHFPHLLPPLLPSLPHSLIPHQFTWHREPSGSAATCGTSPAFPQALMQCLLPHTAGVLFITAIRQSVLVDHLFCQQSSSMALGCPSHWTKGYIRTKEEPFWSCVLFPIVASQTHSWTPNWHICTELITMVIQCPNSNSYCLRRKETQSRNAVFLIFIYTWYSWRGYNNLLWKMTPVSATLK